MAQSQKSLNAVFTDVANAIRTKAGTNQTIAPIDFADEILKLGSSTATLDIITNGTYNVLGYGSVNVQVAGDTSPQLYPPTSFSVDFNTWTASVVDNTEILNGAFPRYFCYYLNDDVIHSGEANTLNCLHDYIKRGGEQAFRVSFIGPLFEESIKLSHPFNLPDLGGYFRYTYDGCNYYARFLNSYHVEQNEFGQTIVVDEDLDDIVSEM